MTAGAATASLGLRHPVDQRMIFINYVVAAECAGCSEFLLAATYAASVLTQHVMCTTGE